MGGKTIAPLAKDAGRIATAVAQALQESAAPALPEPSDATKAAIVDAQERVAKRSRRARVKLRQKDGNVLDVSTPHADETGYLAQVQNAFGSSSVAFAASSLGSLLGVCLEPGGSDEQTANAALALVDGIRPEDELEAALATQIAATHALSLRMLRKANLTTQRDFLDSYVTAATKLQRTMTVQIEALTRLRRGGQQNVTVKHVHVHEGGHAIVGQVTTGGGRGEIENRRQPHARTLQHVEMQGEDAIGGLLPVSRGQEPDQVPHARRR